MAWPSLLLPAAAGWLVLLASWQLRWLRVEAEEASEREREKDGREEWREGADDGGFAPTLVLVRRGLVVRERDGARSADAHRTQEAKARS